MEQQSKPIIGITLGEINGISPELAVKTFSDRAILEQMTPVLIGSSQTLMYYKRRAKNQYFNFHQVEEGQKFKAGKVNVLSPGKNAPEVTVGKPTKESGEYALQCLDKAIELAKEEKIDALVTLPLNKDNIILSAPYFSGHTGYLAKAFESSALMIMHSDEMKIALATEHIALNEVSEKVTNKLLRSKIKQLCQSLKSDFLIQKPKIAVLGMNPHAGENGNFGDEEARIGEVIQELFMKEKMNVWGPYSSDAFFGQKQYRNFDATLALYHDQGMIPFKLTADGGVNYSAGLPIIRTSPAHGTALDLAGQNKANPQSLRDALYLAVDLAQTKKSISPN